MAYELNVESITVKAAANLSTDPDATASTACQYRFLKESSTGVVRAAAATDNLFGVLQNKPTDTHAATVGIGGVSKLKLGTGGATVGANLTSDADGKGVVTTTTGNYVGAIALAAGSAGDYIPALIVCRAVKV